MTNGLFVLSPEWGDALYGPEEHAALSHHCHWVAPTLTPRDLRANLELLRDVEVIFASWGMTPLDVELLRAAPKLRAVFHAGGSIRYFMTDAAWERNLVIASASALNALPVVEYALATILFSLRHGWYYARRAHRDGSFPPARPMPGGFGSVVGLISLGAIGRLVAERLRPFDVQLLAYDPFADAEELARLKINRAATLEEVFATADVVSLHTPLLPETTGLIRRAHFSAMKLGSTFINTARGAVVREDEMIEVLRLRPDLQAVLDVTWPEPPVPGSPLYSLENVVLTPHIAGTTKVEARRLGRAMTADALRWLKGAPLEHQITRQAFTRLA